MLNCNQCGFLVTKEMSFSIKKNECPSCGKRLMDNRFISDVKDIKTKVSASRILNEKSPENMLNLLCIFIRNNFFVEEEETFTENLFEDLSSKDLEESSDSNVTEESEDLSLDAIRDQVRSEYENKIDSATEVETGEQKVERLKLLARNSIIKKKTGTSVRRLSGD